VRAVRTASSLSYVTATSTTQDDFDRLVSPHRRELHAHCYRMLGSVQDAEDAVQEALLRAWRSIDRFEGRASLRNWLYTIATNCCLDLLKKRPKRVTPMEFGPAPGPDAPIDWPAVENVWLEPYPDEQLGYEQRESVELAFITALQHLPANQRAVLIMREVLGFSAQEAAAALDTSVASINSALQRARKAVEEKGPQRSQQETLRTLGDDRIKKLVDEYVDAWERADVEGILAMLAQDATFSMPPASNWFRGHADIGAFLPLGPLIERRRFIPIRANGQLAFGTYIWMPDKGRYRGNAVHLIDLDADGLIADVTCFLTPEVFSAFGLPAEPPASS
jgi:RNA polymerase sigma-70 factor (ECF subfamily)